MIEKQSVVESSVEGYTAGRIPGLVVVDGDAVLAAVTNEVPTSCSPV